MLATIIRRCLGTIPLLFVLSVVSFAIIKSLPGDPVDILLGTAQRDISPAQVSEMRRELGLDKPPAQQYASWIAGVLCRAQLGRSYRDGRPVAEVIAERLPATMSLVATSLIFAFTFGITSGLLMAAINSTKFGPLLENFMITTALVFYSAPGFWLGFLVIALITQCPGLSWLPVLGLHAPGVDSVFPTWRYLILPALVLSCRRTAKVALFVRASTLEELAKDYVIIARSKGLSKPGVIVRHVAKNSLLPAVSLAGLSLPALLGGSVLIENVFGWPGMGRLAVDATFGRNYPVLLALIMIYGALVVVANMISDLVQMAMDPRMREHEQFAAAGGTGR